MKEEQHKGRAREGEVLSNLKSSSAACTSGVCLHSYNDTASANAEVIIERRFYGLSVNWGGQILRSLRFAKIAITLFLILIRVCHF